MFDTFLILAPFLILLIVALLRFTGCEIPDSGTMPPGPPTLAPLPPGLSPGGGLGPGMSVTFQPMVGGNPMSAEELSATFSMNAPSGSMLTQNGTFTAPFPRVPSNTTAMVLLKNTSGAILASTTVNLEPATVNILFSPNDHQVTVGQMVHFQATYSNVSPPSGQQVQVVWMAVHGPISAEPLPTDGSVAIYTAPAVLPTTTETVSFTINNTDPAPMGTSSVILDLIS